MIQGSLGRTSNSCLELTAFFLALCELTPYIWWGWPFILNEEYYQQSLVGVNYEKGAIFWSVLRWLCGWKMWWKLHMNGLDPGTGVFNVLDEAIHNSMRRCASNPKKQGNKSWRHTHFAGKQMEYVGIFWYLTEIWHFIRRGMLKLPLPCLYPKYQKGKNGHNYP